MPNLFESPRRIAIAARLLFKDLLRRRLTLLLLFLVPALFDAIVLATTDKAHTMEITIGSLVEPGAIIHRPGAEGLDLDFQLLDDGARQVTERGVTLVFLGMAAVCFLACFLAFNLVQNRTLADRRLVLAGYRPREVLASKLLLLVALAAIVAAYETACIRPYVAPVHLGRVALGFFLGGLEYGCAGLFIGSVVRHELEGVFCIVLLANVDAGWLQNPIYYAQSTNRRVIEAMPAWAPTQLAIAGAFDDQTPPGMLRRALLYWAALLAVALLAFALRIRPARSA
jgi:ABC-2 type transport system permease protein